MANGGRGRKLKVSTSVLQRPRYEAENYLAAQDLLTEQRYRRQHLRRHNRYLHDWGVICGLLVAPVNDPTRPWTVQVCPGYAIDCCGDEIEVHAPTVVNIHDYLWRRPSEQGQPARVAFVGIRYAERSVRPIPANPPQCGCDEPIYKPSRIRDSFQVDVLWVLPETDNIKGFDLCGQNLAICPECPDDLHVILACVNLPASEGDPVIAEHIDNWSCRRQF